jgi:hypothetical protein
MDGWGTGRSPGRPGACQAVAVSGSSGRAWSSVVVVVATALALAVGAWPALAQAVTLPPPTPTTSTTSTTAPPATSTTTPPTTTTPTTTTPTTTTPTTSVAPGTGTTTTTTTVPPAPGSLATGPGAGPATETPPGPPGYWMVASDGGIFDYGSSSFHGSAGTEKLAAPIVGMLPTPDGRGYWLAASDGGVFAYGDARFLGSAVNRPPGAAPIVAIAGTPTGLGYWLFAQDGSVYTIGDATYWGAPPASAVHAPIVAAAATPDGHGYWIVAADGSVYPEGDAAAIGDASQVHLAAPIVAIQPTASGQGYWLVAADGGVLTYGDAPFLGSAGAIHLNQPIVGIESTPDGGGYWLTASDGGVFAYGDARYLGGTGALQLNRPIVAARAMPAAHGTGTAIFFYPWYASQPHDGYWRHWDEGGHTPPDDIGSDYYPLRGAYSSLDPDVLSSQMGDIASIGVDEAIVSWWGQGSFEDQALPLVVAAAKLHGVQIGVQIEPYVGRTAASVAGDFAYLSALGITDIWVYQADLLSRSGLAAANASAPGIRTWAESGSLAFVRSGEFAGWAAAAGFHGVYLYDAINYEAADFPAFCASARQFGLLCAPVAAPGFTSVRAEHVSYGRSRDNGATYDSRWMGDLGARPDVVVITSYNEWHEGTQIEPAVPYCPVSTSVFCYENYEGAYGQTGLAASYAYLNRTGVWTARLAADNP